MIERVVRFGDEGGLVGILTEPEGEWRSAPVPVHIFLNSGIIHRVGASRIHVTIARSLAEAGIPSLRFDFSGIGDSEARRDAVPFARSAVLEVGEAMDFLARTRGVESFVLVGLCSGADMAYEAALVDERVEALVQFDPYVYRTPGWFLRHYGPRLLSARSWIHSLRVRIRALAARGGSGEEGSPDFVAPEYRRVFPPREQVRKGVVALVDRGVRMLVCFTGDEPHINARGQYAQGLGIPSGAQLEVEYIPQADHTFTHPDHQRWLAARVTRWSRECFLPEAQGGAGAV